MIANPVEKARIIFNDNLIRVVVLLLLGIPFLYGGMELLSRFPRTYTWSELLINYQGGFVRRGLLGEVSYQLNGVIQARYFLSIISVLVYLIILRIIVFREKNSFSLLIFLFSPATILFPVYDMNAFARKDLFILLAFVLSVYLLDHIRSQTILLLLTMFIYGLVGLVVESTCFYLPMACAVIILNRNNFNSKIQSRFWMVSLFFVIVCFLFISLVNTYHLSKVLIIDSWRLLYPSYQWDELGFGAISFLGLPLKDGLLLTFASIFHRATLEGYFYSFLLASIPVLWLLLNCKFKKLSKLSILGITWAFTVMLCSFAFSTDWGRCIYLFTIHTFLFLIVITNYRAQTDNEMIMLAKPSDDIALKAILLFVYATSWQVEHWVVSGQSALRPGFLIVSFRKLFAVVFGGGS